MSVQERNFSNYQLSDNVYELADSLLPEIARATSYELDDHPTEGALQGFVSHIGPAKWLQDNIGLVQERLGREQDAVTIVADWAERSGILAPMERSFMSPEMNVPTEFDYAVITGGVARWMLRRTNHLRQLSEYGVRVGRAKIVAGSRVMKATESPFVEDYAHVNGTLPTESQFAGYALRPYLQDAGIAAEMVSVESEVGDEVVRTAVEAIGDSGTVLAVANAPAGIQVAGQYRLAAQGLHPRFDLTGDQLFVSSDTIGVARQNESPATHQNPYTALGQIARNALFLYRNQA